MNDIRIALIDDLENVMAIVRDATKFMDTHGIPQWDEAYPSRAVLQKDIENQHMYVIDNKGETAGFITLNEVESAEYREVVWAYHGRILVVHRLTIAPTHQGRKLASQLMDFAEQKASSEGYDAIRLDAFTLNPAALHLYESRGYWKAGTVRFRKGLFYCYEQAISRGRKENDNP